MMLLKLLRVEPLLRRSALLLLIALTGCNQPPDQSNSAASEDCQTVIHDGGETKVCAQPKRIVTVGPNLLELLLALDVQPVGHAEYFPTTSSTFERPAQQIPYLGERLTGMPRNVGTASDPSMEAIASLQPDLILADSLKNKDEYALLSQIAPTLLFNYSDAERDWQTGLRAIAAPLNKTEQAETLIAQEKQRFDRFRDRLQPVAATYPNVLMFLSEQIEQAIEIETPNSACGGLMEDLGFEVMVPSSLKNPEQTSTILSLEAIPQLGADLIIVEGYNSDTETLNSDPVAHQMQGVKQQWEKSAIAQSISANKAGRVYFTTTYLCHALIGPIGTDIFLNQLEEQLQPLLTD